MTKIEDFVQDGKRWVIPYLIPSRNPEGTWQHKAIVDWCEGNAGEWRYVLYGVWIGSRETPDEAKARAVELLNAPEIFCHTPEKCTAAGRCLKETVCNA